MTLQRALALFALGTMLFGWPALAIVERFGAGRPQPVLYLYLMGAWALLAVAVAAASRAGRVR